MPDVVRYTPAQMVTEVNQLVQNYNDALNVFDRIEDSIEYSKEGTQYESDLVAARAEIAQDNEYFDDISEAIVDKDGGSVPAKSEMAQRIEALPIPLPPVEEKDVNFYDYDGTLLYSYTFSEATHLLELPEMPDHEGLTAQEWNWSLANIKLQAQNNWNCDIGALYVSADGATYLYFEVPKGSRIPELNINLLLAKNQSVTIDWGDGTTSEENNSTNSNKAIRFTKTDYSFKSDDSPLVVKLIGGLFDLGDCIHWGSSIFTNANNSYEFAPLEKIVFGTNCTGLLAGAFNRVRRSYTVINSKDAKLKDAYVFHDSGITFYVCNSINASRTFSLSTLCNIIVSDNIAVSIASDYNFKSSLISNIILPFGIKSINQHAFEVCLSLTYIKIPNTVETIGAYAFIECFNLAIVDLTAFTDPSSIPSLSNSNTFSNIYSNAVFYVANQTMLDAFTTATNWSTYADRFQIKPTT